MRKSFIRPLTLTALIMSLGLGGCAARQDQKGAGTRPLEIKLGGATSRALEQRTAQVLQIYGFIMVIEQISPTRIHLETTWQFRNVFEDEALAGAVSAETRLILRGGPIRGSTRGMQSNRSVLLVAENRFHNAEGEIISSRAYSAEFKAYIREIAAELTAAYHIDAML